MSETTGKGSLEQAGRRSGGGCSGGSSGPKESERIWSSCTGSFDGFTPSKVTFFAAKRGPSLFNDCIGRFESVWSSSMFAFLNSFSTSDGLNAAMSSLLAS